MEKGKAAAQPASPDEADKKRYAEALKILDSPSATPEVCEEAIDLLTQVLEYRCEKFGELSVECAPAFYNYGIALFTKARLENDVFGAPVQKAMVEKAIRQMREEDNKAAGEGKENKDKPEAADKDGEDVEEVEGEEDDLEEEENDMELAWRNLETARLIWGKQGGYEREISDVYSALADLSLEREDFETSVADYRSALFVLKAAEGADRVKAELHYKLCLALQLSAKDGGKADALKSAAEECKKAIDILGAQEGMEDILEELREKEEELKESASQAGAAAGKAAGASTSQLGFDAPTLKGPVTVQEPKRRKL